MTMRIGNCIRSVGVVLLSWIAEGCGGAPEITGTWEIDRQTMRDQLQAQAADAQDPMLAGMARMALGMIDDMTWTASLNSDGSLLLTILERGYDLETDGTWQEADGILTLTYLDEGNRQQTISGSLQSGRLHMAPENPGQPGLVLMRTGAPAAVAAAEPPPPMGPLRSDCPPTLTGESRAEGAPVDDIVGLRPRQPFADVLGLLECRDDIRIIQTAPLWSAGDNFGIPTRQLLRASDGVPCSDREAARRGHCDTGGGRFAPLKDISREYIVAFTGMPDQEIARVIWRRDRYTADDSQGLTLLAEALNGKYGAPQLQATGSHLRLNHTRAGATSLVWLYGRDGVPVYPPASQFSTMAMNWESCANGPQPVFTASHSWNSGCNLTIRAELLPHPDNSVLAAELNIVVMNQRDLYHGARQFETALRLVSEEALRKRGTSAEL